MSMSHNKPNLNPDTIKVSFIGPTNVGKTSLIKALVNEPFDDYYTPTIGVDLRIRTNYPYKIQLWDLAGNDKYRRIIKTYIETSDILIFCFSAEDKTTLFDMVDLYVYYYDIVETKKTIILITKTESKNIDQEYKSWVNGWFDNFEGGCPTIIETDGVNKKGFSELIDNIVKLFKIKKIEKDKIKKIDKSYTCDLLTICSIL